MTHFGDYSIIFSTLSLATSSLCIAFILIGETSRTTTAQRDNMDALSRNMTEEEYNRLIATTDTKDPERTMQSLSELKHRRVSTRALSINSTDGDYRRMKDTEMTEDSHVSRSTEDSMLSDSNCWRVSKALLKNQLLLAVLFGALTNVLCRSVGMASIPPFFEELLQTLSSPFSFTALFLMGIGMAGKISIGTFFGRKVECLSYWTHSMYVHIDVFVPMCGLSMNLCRRCSLLCWWGSSW